MKEGLNLEYLRYFYEFLVLKKGKKFVVFLLYIFFFSLFPYMIVAYTLDYNNQNQLRSFYGDGSILTLCSGILLSYYSIFFKSKKKKDNDSNDDTSEDNSIIAGVLVIIYVIVLFQFYFCQTQNRDWSMIINVIFGSFLLLILTFGVSAYLHFREDISYLDIQKYIEEKKEKKLSQKANETRRTDDDIQL